MSTQDDSQFMKTFGMVMAGLTVVGIILFALALMLGSFGGDEQARAQLERERAERILQPIGAVRIDGEAMPAVVARAAAEQPAADTDRVRSGQQVYQSSCMACHAAGVLGAPRSGDGEKWQTLLDEKGFDTLLKNSIQGIGAMPPRGGDRSLSDEEVKNAVVYMLEQAGIALDD